MGFISKTADHLPVFHHIPLEYFFPTIKVKNLYKILLFVVIVFPPQHIRTMTPFLQILAYLCQNFDVETVKWKQNCTLGCMS